jgi:hypothetical protein
MEENERRSSGKTPTKKSGCYMTNTEVEMLQEDKEDKENNKEICIVKDMQKEEEGKEDEKNKKKTT